MSAVNDDYAGTPRPIGERFQRDRVAMLTLPAAPYEPCGEGYRAKSTPWRWCAIEPTTTQCRLLMDIVRC